MLGYILTVILFLEGQAVPSPQVHRLAAGVRALAPRPISWHTAHRLASEAVDVTEEPEYRWLAPVDLLALAAVESDFREHLIAENGKPTKRGWDCGISGVRVTIYHGRTRRARELCNRLAASTYLSFRYSARELTNYRTGHPCKKFLGTGQPWKLKRCVFNSYKAGPRYSKASKYWVAHHCYRTGILLRRRPRKWRYSCRRAKSLRWIKKVF